MKLNPIIKYSLPAVFLLVAVATGVYNYKYFSQIISCVVIIIMINAIDFKHVYRYLASLIFLIIAMIILVYDYQYFKEFVLCAYAITLVPFTTSYYKKKKEKDKDKEKKEP